MTIAEALRAATARLDAAGVADPQRQASSLLTFALTSTRTYLITHADEELSAEDAEYYDSLATRREAREPFQYITGRQEFWRLEFAVVPGVLIPRPETEILVEAAIEFLRPLARPRFVEAGVGSGCISVSILHALPKARAIATDLSPVALSTATLNAETHNVADRLGLLETDLFEDVVGKFDLVVSNPPYIPDDEIHELQPEVRDFEPREALAGGPDGLDIIRRVVDGSRQKLSSGGVLMMEIGAGQADAVKELFDPMMWRNVHFKNDLQGIPRVVIAERWESV